MQCIRPRNETRWSITTTTSGDGIGRRPCRKLWGWYGIPWLPERHLDHLPPTIKSQALYNQIRAPPMGVNEGSVENNFPKRTDVILLLILPHHSEYVKCQAGRPTSYAMDTNNSLKKGAWASSITAILGRPQPAPSSRTVRLLIRWAMESWWFGCAVKWNVR